MISMDWTLAQPFSAVNWQSPSLMSLGLVDTVIFTGLLGSELRSEFWLDDVVAHRVPVPPTGAVVLIGLALAGLRRFRPALRQPSRTA
jgi:hypothetical protein